MKRYQTPLIGDDMVPGSSSSGSMLWWGFIILVGLGAAFVALVLSSLLMARDAENIKRISGVPPVNNEVSTLEGPGIGITPSAVAHTITFANTGVLSNIAGAGIAVSSATGHVTITNTGVLTVNARPPLAGNILLSPGTGISVVNGAGSNEIVFGNTGVLSNIAGAGIAVSGATGDVTISNTGVLTVNSRAPLTGNILLSAGNGISIANGAGSNEIDVANTGVLSNIAGTGMTVSGATGDVTVTHTLAAQTLLDDTDANGPQVRYGALVSSVAMNTWHTATLSVVDNGQGNVGGTAWQVPTAGLYDFRAHCVTPFNQTDYEAIHLALTLGATTDDPGFDGYLPSGAHTTARVGTVQASAISLSALVHAGCTGCPVPNGAALKLHAYLDNQIYSTTLTLVCSIQVGRVF